MCVAEEKVNIDKRVVKSTMLSAAMKTIPQKTTNQEVLFYCYRKRSGYRRREEQDRGSILQLPPCSSTQLGTHLHQRDSPFQGALESSAGPGKLWASPLAALARPPSSPFPRQPLTPRRALLPRLRAPPPRRRFPWTAPSERAQGVELAVTCSHRARRGRPARAPPRESATRWFGSPQRPSGPAALTGELLTDRGAAPSAAASPAPRAADHVGAGRMRTARRRSSACSAHAPGRHRPLGSAGPSHRPGRPAARLRQRWPGPGEQQILCGNRSPAG